MKVHCKNCGEHFSIPEEFGRPKKVRCPMCDAVCVVAPSPSTAADEKTAIRPPVARSRAPAPIPVQLVPESRIEGTQDEEDDKPYPLPRDPEQKMLCPHCQKPVPRDAVICNRCGFDRETNTIVQRAYDKVAKHWIVGLALNIRLTLFLISVAILFLGTAFAPLGGSLAELWLGRLSGTLLLAFLLGTFPRLDLTRSKKGQVRLTKTWRGCFIAWPPMPVEWRGHEGVSVTRFHKSGLLDYLVLVFLLPFVIPPILWWYYIIHADQFEVNLTRDHGTPATLLYRGRNQAMAEEMAANIRSVTGLP